MGEYFSDLHTKKNKNNIATSYTTYRTKRKTFTYICVYLSSYIYKYASGHQF